MRFVRARASDTVNGWDPITPYTALAVEKIDAIIAGIHKLGIGVSIAVCLIERSVQYCLIPPRKLCLCGNYFTSSRPGTDERENSVKVVVRVRPMAGREMAAGLQVGCRPYYCRWRTFATNSPGST